MATPPVFKGSNVVAAPRERVWELLQDPQVLSRVIPGLSDVVQEAPGQFRATLSVNKGPIKQKFKANVRLSNMQAPESMEIQVEGKNMTGGASVQAALSLTSVGEAGTRVDWEARPSLSGLLSSLGGKLLESKASEAGAGQSYANRFFGKLSDQA